VPAHHGRILYDAAFVPKQFWELNVPGHVVSGTDAETKSNLLEYLSLL
jgi:hypothetical protein